MTSTAFNPAPSNRPTPRQTGSDEEARAAQLRAANINPRTGLATDYLNHFNEAIMLLEMIPDIPECAEDFLDWHPLTYREHFMASHFKARELAIEAYDSADENIRAEFDNITSAMTSTASTQARSDRPTQLPIGPDAEARAALLRAANINPRTGLATDYLNHFNEAIMMLEMIPDIPDCAEDFLAWYPLSYAEHFTLSNFRARDLAIEAYELAATRIRAEFDNITSTMTSILTAVGAAMREVRQDKTRATLAEQATIWVKPLVMLAGGIINGGTDADVETIMAGN